jgi:hypothetical protein
MSMSLSLSLNLSMGMGMGMGISVVFFAWHGREFGLRRERGCVYIHSSAYVSVGLEL